MKKDCGKTPFGFTLIELLVVLAIVALLTTLTLPRYFQNIDKGKEVVLVENLRTVRESIDQFYSDTGRYPDTLSELVEKKYLKNLPLDPITESATTWIITPPENAAQGSIYSISSGAPGNRSDGRPFSTL